MRPALEAPKKATQKKNPLKNRNVMARLNPGVLHKRMLRANAQKDGTNERKIFGLPIWPRLRAVLFQAARFAHFASTKEMIPPKSKVSPRAWICAL